MRQIVSMVVLVAFASAAWAQDAGLPAITVHPSGAEDPAAGARERQERLSRRLQESEFAFRSICTHCVRGERAEQNPFYPIDVLGRAMPREPKPGED